VTEAAPEGNGARELFVRHARRDGRSVAILRAVDYGDSCVIEAEVYPAGGRSAEPTRPGPCYPAAALKIRASSPHFDHSNSSILFIQSQLKLTSTQFSDAAGKPSATILEQRGRGEFKATRLNKAGHLITGYYDLPKPAPHSALPVIIAVINTPAFIPFL